MPSSKRKKESNNLIYHLKELEEGETTKPKVSRREEIIKIQEGINKIEVKKPATFYKISLL